MKKNSRRSFLKAAAGVTGAGLIGIPSLASSIEKSVAKTCKGDLITRPLGKTGIVLPVVSMGVMNADNPNLVKGAWKSGIMHFDTAWYYQGGNNEKMLGKVFKELNINREDFIIATKVLLMGAERNANGPDKKKLFMDRFNESLSRLQTDYVDILYYHDVWETAQISDPVIIEAFTELKEKKKIRFCGFSAHRYWPDLVEYAVEQKFYDVLLLSYNYAMNQDTRSAEAMKKAFDAGIGLIAMKTQCQQDWYKEALPSEAQKFYEGKIMHTALLKWVMRHEFITTAIPGFTTFQQLEEDTSLLASLEYTKEEEQFLADQQVKLALQGVCRQCRTCIDGCPVKTEIPELMRTHMYSFAYGNAFKAKQTLTQISSGKGLDNCIGCDECTATCKYSVPIASRIASLKELYA